MSYLSVIAASRLKVVGNPELYSQDNAASKITETDATTGWGDVGVTLSVAGVAKADTQAAKDGDFSIKIVAADGSSDRGEYVFSGVGGISYRVSVSTLLNVSSSQFIKSWTNVDSSPSLNLSGDATGTWIDRDIDITVTSTGNCILRFYAADSGSGGDVLYVDNFSIVEL